MLSTAAARRAPLRPRASSARTRARPRPSRAHGSLQGAATLLACILEAKPPTFVEGKEDAGEDEDRWVGVLDSAIHPGREVHRDAMFGITLDAKLWGRGFGTPSCRLRVRAENVRVVELYKHIGFVEEVKHRKLNWQDAKWGSMVAMSVLREEWPAPRALGEASADFVGPGSCCNVGVVTELAGGSLWRVPVSKATLS